MDSLLLESDGVGAKMTLYGDIGRWCEVDDRMFASAMLTIKGKPLDIFLNSGGGEVATAQAIRCQIERHDAPVTIHIEGMAASAATIIACAINAHVIMDKGALYMIHAPLMDTGFANAKELRHAVDILEACGQTLVDVYSARTKRSAQEIIEIMERETYMTASTAVALGFVDETSVAIKACGNTDAARVIGYSRQKYRESIIMKAEEQKEPIIEEEEKREPCSEEKKEPCGEEMQEGEPMPDEEMQEDEPMPDDEENPDEENPDGVEEEEPKCSAAARKYFMALGAKRERARIKSIEASTLPGHEKLARAAKFDKPMTASAFALAQCKAEKTKKAAYQRGSVAESEEIGAPVGVTNTGVARGNSASTKIDQYYDGLKAAIQARVGK